MFSAGNSPMRLKLFLLGSWGFLWVRIMGSWNVMGLGYGSNIRAIQKHRPKWMREKLEL
jgi:hypothetical protein